MDTNMSDDAPKTDGEEVSKEACATGQGENKEEACCATEEKK